MSEENIYQRLSKASGMCEKLAKDNQGHNYKYVSHDQYVAMVRPILTECGIHVVFGASTEGGLVDVKSIWINVDHPEQTFESRTQVPLQRKDPQAVGAALSYAKKYILALNLMIETGDDADSTQEHTRNQQAQTKAQKEQADLMAKGKQLVTDLGLSDDDKNRLWLESGKDLAVYVGELEEMAQRVANDEAKELEGAGQ